eukprot:6182235-Pleurochrysis_carterae.AAC.4
MVFASIAGIYLHPASSKTFLNGSARQPSQHLRPVQRVREALRPSRPSCAESVHPTSLLQPCTTLACTCARTRAAHNSHTSWTVEVQPLNSPTTLNKEPELYSRCLIHSARWICQRKAQSLQQRTVVASPRPIAHLSRVVPSAHSGCVRASCL